MPDNWGFVAAAYGLTAAVLVFYWRSLVRKEKQLGRSRPPSRSAASVAERSRELSRTGHPRLEPDAKPSLPNNP